MRIHLYRIIPGRNSPPLGELLMGMRGDGLAQRMRTVAGQDIRVEDIHRSRDGHWYVDLLRLRWDHGPGKARRTTPVEGFELDEDETFAEETSALYDEATGYMAVEYNHFGVRVGTMESYFDAYRDGASYTFEMTFDRDVQRRLERKRVFRSLTFAVAPQKVGPDDFRANVSVAEAIEMGRRAGANVVTVSLSMGLGSRGHLDFNMVRNTITTLIRAARGNDEDVTKLEVRAKDNPDAPSEVLDLLEPRLAIDIDDLPVGRDRRVSRRNRYEALLRAFRGWSGLIERGRVA